MMKDPRLTPRERQVMQLVLDGATNEQIGRALEIAQGTVKVHVASAYRRLSVANRREALARRSQLAKIIRKTTP